MSKCTTCGTDVLIWETTFPPKDGTKVIIELQNKELQIISYGHNEWFGYGYYSDQWYAPVNTLDIVRWMRIPL